jgi:protein-tyrosine phosphatase
MWTFMIPRCHFEGEDWVKYRKFSIGRWRTDLGTTPTAAATLAYFEPHLSWIENELSSGRHVLVHCLAGAHRAGTAGIASLMWLLNIPCEEAIRLAKSLRPVIQPIGGYPMLLQLLSDALFPRRTASLQPS